MSQDSEGLPVFRRMNFGILFGKGPGGWDSWDGWDGWASWYQQINRQLEAQFIIGNF